MYPISIVLAVTFAIPATAVDTNLIANPSAEISINGSPQNWASNSWGSNRASFSYSNSGHSGARSLYVSLSRRVSGDAKWMADAVSITGGQSYKYTDFSQSNVMTELDAAFKNAAGQLTFVYLGSVPSGKTWHQTTKTFTAPLDAVSVSVYHIIATNGWLQTDDFSLSSIEQPAPTPPPVPAPTTNNLLPNGSLENSTLGAPDAWLKSNWGSNTPTFQYINGDAHSGSHSAKVSISNYVSGDAKWYFEPLQTLTQGGQYSFSVWFKSNTQPRAVVYYADTNWVDHYYTLQLPVFNTTTATTWQQYKDNFDIPSNAKAVSVYFLIANNGWLQTDDYSIEPYSPLGFNAPIVSLTFDDGLSSIYDNGLPILKKYGFSSTQYIISGTINDPGYMTTAMVTALRDANSEIASHTVNHPDLTTLTSTQLNAELSNSQMVLRNLFGTSSASNFASPYGRYNPFVQSAVKQYYQSHRSTDSGYNSRDNYDPYNIRVQNIQTNTTTTEVASWVEKAKATKTWLVLVYHNVNTSIDANDYAVTPANLDIELANIKASGVLVLPVGQALATIQSQI